MVKTKGWAGLDVTKVIEIVTHDTPTPTPTPDEDIPKYEGPIGQPGEERTFETGTHVIQVYHSRTDENGNKLTMDEYLLPPYGYHRTKVIHIRPTYAIIECVNLEPVIAVADENGEFRTPGTLISELEYDSYTK